MLMENHDKQALRSYVNYLLKLNKTSVGGLAKNLNTSQYYLQKMIDGEKPMSPKVIFKILNLLEEVPEPDELILRASKQAIFIVSKSPVK